MEFSLKSDYPRENLIVGGGELGELIRAFNWSDTVLGPLPTWPQSLVTSVNMLLLSPVPMVLLWTNDGIMLYNNAYSIFAAQRHPFLLGSKVVEGWPEVADFNRNVLKNVLSGSTLSYKDQELTLYRNNRPEQVWMNLDYSPIPDETGKPAGVIAIVNETTQIVIAEAARKNMELALSRSEEHLRALITATSDVIYTMNADWSEMGVLEGRVFVPDTGKPRNDWFENNIPDEEKPLVRQSITNAIRSKSVFHLEHRIRKSDGTTGWTLSRAIPIINQEGEIEKWFGAASDITERKRTEEALQEKNAQLVRINSDLDNFIYTASHDLKAPVSNIEGLVAAIIEDLKEEPYPVGITTSHHLELMQHSIAQFKNTINDLTEISKVQKLHQEDMEEIVVQEIFEEIKWNMLDPATQSNVRIHADFSAVSTLRFSKKNFRSIVYNLLSNALKYRDPNREPEVSIQLTHLPEWHVLKVTDNGLGIKKEDQKKIFSMFRRLHTLVEGTGIGLYIVKKIVENAGGYVETESEIGKGTTFFVYFKK